MGAVVYEFGEILWDFAYCLYRHKQEVRGKVIIRIEKVLRQTARLENSSLLESDETLRTCLLLPHSK